MDERLLYTIGHGARSWEDFEAVLRGWGVRTIVDVRRYPVSRRHPQFSQRAMRGRLEEAGIEYAVLGQHLGGRIPDGRSYEAYMASDDFERGVFLLEEAASDGQAAILCAETSPWQCHRRHIAEAMRTRGWRVVHLIDAERAEEGLPLGPGG